MGRGADPNHKMYWTREWIERDGSGNRLPPLHSASREGNIKIVTALITDGKHRADIDECSRWSKMTPLLLACRNGHKNIVQYLIEEAKCKIGK